MQIIIENFMIYKIIMIWLINKMTKLLYIQLKWKYSAKKPAVINLHSRTLIIQTPVCHFNGKGITGDMTQTYLMGYSIASWVR